MSSAAQEDKEERDKLPEPTADPAPDGGLTAWLQVFGSFWAWFNTFGLTNAFGEFQTYYSQTRFSGESPALISLIGSIQPFVLILFGFLAGPLWDAGYCRTLVIAGTAIVG